MTQTANPQTLDQQTLDQQTLTFPPSLRKVDEYSEHDSLSPATIPGGDAEPTPGRRHRLASFLRGRLRSMIWFIPLLLVSAVVNFINFTGSPQRIDDEGTYTAQAYAVDKLGSLTHYTYWYDHPPLGWIQIAGWTKLTDGFARYTSLVMAGREFMIVCALVSCALLWMLARRLDMSRPAAAAAVFIFAVSPLAVQFHRTVFLDNVATPWLLAAFVLAFAPRRQLIGFAAAAGCFAIAVLTKETYLLFLPFLAWQMWRSAHHGTRRYTVSLAAGIMVLLGAGYALLAVIKGELFPGADRVSLFSGIFFQLEGRTASGSLFDAGTQARVTLNQWLDLDPVLAVVAPIAALAVLRSKKFWPLAASLIFLIVFMMRPGYLPVPYVIAMLPLAALVIPGAVEVWWRRARSKDNAGKRLAQTVAVGVIAALAVGVAAPMWAPKLRGLLLADLDQPMVQAESWVDQNVNRGYKIVVDDSMWVDFVRAGFPRNNVVWYYKVDTDPAVEALAPNGWRDYDYVISTNSMRTFPDGSPTVAQGLKNSTEVAHFGTGDRAVIVYRIHAEGEAAVTKAATEDAKMRSAVGAQLVTNSDLSMPTPVRDLITGGRVDARILLTLPRAALIGKLTIADAPAVPGEETESAPRRQVLISAVNGKPLADSPQDEAELKSYFNDQVSPFVPRSMQETAQGLLVTYDTNAPSGLIPDNA